MRPDQLVGQATRPTHFWLRRWGLLLATWMLGGGPVALGQVPPPVLDPSRATDLVARRAAIVRDEQARRTAMADLDPRADATPGDGSSRFDPLDEVVPAAQARPIIPAPAVALRLEVAGKLFDLAIAAARTPAPPLAFIDECLRGVLRRQPDHAEARRLLGFVPHERTGWATPFAAQEIAAGKVKDPTFGWVPKDWVPHLQQGELPAPRRSGRWLPTDEADALRRDWPNGWIIQTEHFEIHANVPLAGVISFGRQLETFHQLFFALMADLIGADQLPLAQRLRNPKLQPGPSPRPKHVVSYFATRAEYAQHLAPALNEGASQSLGIYLPKKEFRQFGGISYFFNDVGGQLDVTATLYHEVSHQLLFESAGTTRYALNEGNYWVFEGLGTYFETLETSNDGSLRVGGLVGPRIASARKRIIDDHELIPLGEFVAMGPRTFKAELGGNIYLNYAEAMAFAVFLMQSGDGRYREPFLDYARDAYKGQFRQGAGPSLTERLDRSYADLQREFLTYLGRAMPPGRAVSAAPTIRPQ